MSTFQVSSLTGFSEYLTDACTHPTLLTVLSVAFRVIAKMMAGWNDQWNRGTNTAHKVHA